MNNSRSRSELLDFLDYLARKGLMNKATVSARKAAANKVLSVLDDSEAEDVSILDIDDIMGRFNNLNGGKYTPDSLAAYKSRLKTAIDDFLSYLRNPMAFKPGMSSNGRKTTDRQKQKLNKSNQKNGSDLSTNFPVDRSHIPIATPMILPIPLRTDLTIFIQGLPYDLSSAEANKIANVIKAMANPE